MRADRQSGILRDRVSIESHTATRDAIGGVIETWAEDSARNCSIEPINGKEYFAAQGENIAHNIRVRFRYEQGLITPKKRLVNNRVSPQVVYDIESVINPGNENRELIVMCVVRDATG